MKGVKVPQGLEKGNFVGPTVLNNLDKNNRAYKEEIFGPVLVCLSVDTLEEAIEFTNGSINSYHSILKPSFTSRLWCFI